MATFKTEPYTFTSYVHEEWEEDQDWQEVYDQIKEEDPDFEMDFEDFKEAIYSPFYEIKVTCSVQFEELDGGYPTAKVNIISAEI
jgi:hypothetical protein